MAEHPGAASVIARAVGAAQRGQIAVLAELLSPPSAADSSAAEAGRTAQAMGLVLATTALITLSLVDGVDTPPYEPTLLHEALNAFTSGGQNEVQGGLARAHARLDAILQALWPVVSA